MLTFLPLEQIAEMEKYEGSELNKAKEILAHELTELVHGKEEADKALDAARALFSAGNAANMPTADITAEDLNDGSIDVISLLVKSGLVSSRSEGRRAIEQGGVAVNSDKVTDIGASFTADDLKEEFVIRRGKKNFRKINFVG